MVKVIGGTIETFKNVIAQAEEIVCICAGEDCIKFIEENGCEKKVVAVIDNKKSESQLIVNGQEISIMSMAEGLKRISSKTVLVITSLMYADEILKQLDELQCLDNFPVYIRGIFHKRIINDLFESEENTNDYKIPKTIHYCWFGGKEIPDKFKRNIDSWHQVCPDYEIKLWNEDNYDITKNKYMRQAYEARKWGFVPDYARLDIIYNYGGIYLDTDVQLLKNLDFIRKTDFYCGFEENKIVNFGLGFGASINNKIIKACIDEYENLSFINEDGSLNLVASPVYQTNTLSRFGLVQNGKTQYLEDGIVLSEQYLAPFNSMGNGEVTENTISIHQYAATWFDDEEQEKKQRKIRNRQMILLRIQSCG